MVDAPGTRKSGAPPDIQPLERYEAGRAKIRASLRWLLAAAYGCGEAVPPELSEPLYSDQYDQEHLKPGVLQLLLSSDLYCRAASSILRGAPRPKDHGGLLRLLSKRGLEAAVSDAELSSKPVKMGAHLAVMDAMMTLAAMEAVGGVKMAKEAEQIGGGASWENALLFWVNKLNQKLKESTEVEEVSKSQPSSELQPAQPSCPSRWYWKLVPHAIAFCLKESGNKPPVIRYRKDKVQSKQTPTFPFVTQVKDLSNGCAVAAVIHFYCPNLLRLEDVCLKDTMSVADSLYNLQLVKEFCDGCLKGCCPLVLEDLLYTPPTLKLNIMCFVAELLRWFEVEKPDFVRPALAVDLTDPSGLDSCTSPINGNAISASPSFILKQPFLPITSPVSPPDGKGWSKKPLGRPLSAFSIPFPLDSDVDVVMGNPLFRSVSTDSLGQGAPATHQAPYTPPEDLSRLIQTAPLGELPAIEEAPRVTHGPRQRPEGAPDGFYLHSNEEGGSRLSSSAPCRSGMLYRPAGVVPADPKPDSSPRCGRMTSFAERKKRQPEPTESGGDVASSPQHPQGGEDHSPGVGGPAGELGARLEEKRKAIEAQKRRIEAIFTRHRQRLGKTAFLQLKREQGEGGDERAGEAESLEERLTRMEEELQKEEDEEKEQGAPPKLEKQVTFSVEARKEAETDPPLGEYNEAVSKLSSALQSLQRDMQRLTEQQQKLMGQRSTPSPQTTPSKKKAAPSKAWVIPSGSKPSTPPRLSRESTRELSPASSPSRTGTAPKSPQAATPVRKAKSPSSTVPKSPRRPRPARPSDLRFPPLTRVLTPTQNVDTLPHLRRVSPSKCQVQTASSLRLGGPRTPQESPQVARAEESTSESGSGDDHTPMFTLELEAGAPPPQPASVTSSVAGGSSSGAPSECSFDSDVLISAPLTDVEVEPEQEKGAGTLLEAALSALEGPLGGGEETDQEQGAEVFSSDSMSDQTESEARGGVTFYFREDGYSEQEMAQRRASLLERQQRRTEEIRRRRQWQENERDNSQVSSTDELRLSQSLPASHTLLPPFQTTPPATPQRRGAFTRAEYERRHQLKIMSDLEKILRQKPAVVRGGRKPQQPKPRGGKGRGDSSSAGSPARAPPGPELDKGLSHSSHNLASKEEESGTTPTNGPRPEKRTLSRTNSPLAPMSPGHLANQNGDKDWENGSNASSPASIPEYTGPKLYREPSFKSNKFIIHNALSRCCLAGKVNQSQKDKIVEEMERSPANHFLILFRDTSCQFRAVYTVSADSDELVRLCGIGPRVISASAVESIYKYSSDRKQFSPIPSKTMSMSVDAFTIPAHLWHGKKQGTPKKVAAIK